MKEMYKTVLSAFIFWFTAFIVGMIFCDRDLTLSVLPFIIFVASVREMVAEIKNQ